MHTKQDELRKILTNMERVLVAYSGGVDSTYLLKMALNALGKHNVLAVIASSETYPEFEKKEAIELAEEFDANFKVIETSEFLDENFRKNPDNRCFYCKSELFSKLRDIAKELKYNFVVDGSNADDLADYRPGAKAKKENGVRSPLQEAALTKKEIRSFSKELGLKTWNKPSYACLASRIPYGTEITLDSLKKIDLGEQFLRDLGFSQLRVRHHGSIVRIEINKDELPQIIENDLLDVISRKFESLGYTYVTLDLKGYRTGSMNESILTKKA
ncbi:ATP-dependent sacrificial sulfur transferase LarE [Candidatus Saganbacteria bacterium]|nr:ATP-dependent sacrificial sulfur transferase LarE [Candidatus Saganbacteria bacterium]